MILCAAAHMICVAMVLFVACDGVAVSTYAFVSYDVSIRLQNSPKMSASSRYLVVV